MTNMQNMMMDNLNLLNQNMNKNIEVSNNSLEKQQE
jgi:hypothetical protein